MNILIAVIFLVGGLALLWKSAELLVTGAVGLARRLGISSLVIGLTVVAMGTSAPELAASIAGVLQRTGQGGNIAIGNVFGSNIANLALVGGLVALIRPLVVQKQTIRREIPVMILMELLLLPFIYNSYLSRPEALILLVVFAVLILTTVKLARKESELSRRIQAELEKNAASNTDDLEQVIRAGADRIKAKDGIKNVLLVLIGLTGLAVGAKLAVEGAVFIGKQIGLSESVIALTIIAFGTSLPELVTCVVAAVKGHHDISVGNLVGSNIFNTLLVVGGAGTVLPFAIERRFAGGADYWIMIAVSIVFSLAVLFGRRIVSRLSGMSLVCGYIVYVTYLFVYNR